MTESTLRTAIARALFLLDYIHQGEESWETARLDGNNDRNRAFEQADAVLAVLADLPDDVIERAAEGLHDAAFGQELPEAPIDLARAAFRAAFGGEQK